MQIKSGIEIHQQLDTHKLFCNCPSVLRKDEPEFEIRRRLHAVAGEGGVVDIAAKHESEQDREFVYEGYDSTCLVEIDEEPPHLINNEALQTVLHVALLLKCEILPISQIMRKTVVDGSNTSGFQRTVLVARNGYLETESGRVGIDNISLEEDSCRVIDRGEGRFRLDRLGIPLIEIGTAPDIKSPEQAKGVALYIGDILRSCKVKRGIGTIRQDVNVSIPGHPRVEIKGFQDVKMFVPTIEKEVGRQENNLSKKTDLVSQVRNALPDGASEFMRPMPGAARMYPETDLPLLRISKQIIDEAKRTLPKLRSELKVELIKKGLREEEIKILLREDNLEEFENLLKIINEPRFIYKVLIEVPKQVGEINIDIIESIVYAVSEGRLERSDLKQVMQGIISGKSIGEALNIEKADLGDVESEVAKIIKEKPGLGIGGYMGLIMQKFKGKVNGSEANQILNKLLK